MPVVPLDVNDSVLYDVRKVYLSKTTSVTIQDHLDFWGTVFFNGQPISNIGSIPMASQAQAEAGVDNTTVMSPLRTKQAIDAQVIPTNILRNTVFDAKGDIIIGVADNNSMRLPVGTDGQILSADAASTGGLKWIPAPSGGGSGVTDGDKGDIVVSGSGASWMFDSSVVTAAAKTLLDDVSIMAMQTTLGVVARTGDTMTGALYFNDAGGNGLISTNGVGGLVKLAIAGNTRLSISDTYLVSNVPLSLPSSPVNPSDAATKFYVDAGDALFTSAAKGTAPASGGGTTNFLRADGTWAAPPGGGGGVTDGDKGDIIVSGSGSSWLFDSTVVTAAAKTVLDDATTAAMLTTLGAVALIGDTMTGKLTVNYSTAGAGIVARHASAPEIDLLVGAAQTAMWLISGSTMILRTANTSNPMNFAVGGTTQLGLTNTDATFSVPVTIPTADPVIPGHAASKNYVDTYFVPRAQTVNAQTGTTYTLVLTDQTKIVTLSNAAAITLTIPLNSSVAFPVGSSIDLVQIGAGQVTVSATGGVTLNKSMPTAKSRAQFSLLTLIKTATDTWLLTGDAALS